MTYQPVPNYPIKKNRRIWPVIFFGGLGVAILVGCGFLVSVFNSTAPTSIAPTLGVPQPADTTPEPQQSLPPNTIPEGVWNIGAKGQPKAGVYVVAGTIKGELCYWEIARDDAGQDIVSNGNPTGGRPQVTLKKGQWFTTRDCGDWQLKGQGGGGLFVPVSLPTTKTTYVTENLDSSWPVAAAVAYWDKYTSSKTKIVKKCPPSAGLYRCFTIKAAPLPGGTNSPIGYASCSGRYCTIKVDVADAKKSGHFNAATKKWLLVHELGHLGGLDHRKTCVTSMYQYRRCGSKVPPIYFDTSQRAALKLR
jgi:hypothetical protein